MDEVSGSPAPRKARRSSTSKFPLFKHPRGWWCKKIAGKHRYFGKIDDDPEGVRALEEYTRTKDDLLAGREPRPRVEGLTVAQLCNRFLTWKQSLVASGEIRQRTFDELHGTCGRLISFLGNARPVLDLRGEDFAALRADIAKRWGPVRLGNEIQRVRSVFKYGTDEGLLDDANGISRNVRFGATFKKPSKKTMRLARAERGSRMLTPAELKRILKAAGVPMGAMVLLGLNAGFGNRDVGLLPLFAVDLRGGWINFPRPKTGVERRVPLWPETVEAIKVALAQRKPSPLPYVFITVRGEPWAKEGAGNDPIGLAFRRLLEELKLKRPGVSFYSLRHVFQTVAEGAKDLPAVRHVMGHADQLIAAEYREEIGDDRLQAVVSHVKHWLFGPGGLSR